MNLIKKIKHNYFVKLIVDHITNKNFDKASEEVKKLKNYDPLVYFSVLKSLDSQLNDVSNLKLHKKKIIWTISFDSDDQKYINNFLQFYLTKNYKDKFYANNFAQSLSHYLSSFEGHGVPEEIKFSDIIKNSGLFQNLLLYYNKEDLFIFDTCAAFFESKSKKYLIYPNTTLCYFYVIRDIKDLFLRYKKKLETTVEANNELFNLTENLYLSDNLKENQFKVYENKTNYNTNINSWTDPNVVSAYKGKLINYKELVNDTEKVLIDIIQHLKQYYSELKVDYETIKNFIFENEIPKEKQLDISKSENKFLSRNINLINYNNIDL